jgi:hypothetical protein
VLLAKVWFAKVALVVALLFGKERPPARASEIATLRPCWWRPARRAAPTRPAEARPGVDADGGHEAQDRAA